jgi:hypothetical protein
VHHNVVSALASKTVMTAHHFSIGNECSTNSCANSDDESIVAIASSAIFPFSNTSACCVVIYNNRNTQLAR